LIFISSYLMMRPLRFGRRRDVMSVFTVTCDGRPAAVVSASDRINAIACALDLAQARNLLGVMAAPRRFEARPPTEAEMAEWQGQNAEHIILHAPIAA
jgi:hypothetical protein